MFNGQTVSLKTILWKVLNNRLLDELTYERAAELAVEAIRLLGAPLTFTNKVTNPPLEIEDYKIRLPANLVTIRGVRYISNLENYDSESTALTYATDIYHDSDYCETNSNGGTPLEFTYTVSEGVLTTSSQDGHVQISYKALPVDEEGYPLIPDNEKFKLAIEYYITFRYLEPIWALGKITDKVFSYYDTKKCFYMGAAGNSVMLEGIDHLEAVCNSINRLIINTNAHRNFFKGDGNKERLKRYN